MISSSEIREKLAGYPESILQDYDAFKETGDTGKLNKFVIGLIQFLQDTGTNTNAGDLSDDTRLQEDLGIDSITIAEVVFLLEEIFEIEINNQELMDISTVGQLREFIIEKLSSGTV